VFGSYKQASKSGSFDTTTIVQPGSDTAYEDEGVKGAEAGVKAVLLDNALRLNLDGYRYNYTDLQVGTNVVTPAGAIVERTLNAASARVYGIDVDATYRVPAVDGLRLRAGANWNHARFDTFNTAPCWGGQTIAEGCNQGFYPVTGLFTAQNLSGRPLVRAPDWSATFGFDYEISVGNGLTMAIASSTMFSSQYYTNLILRGDTIQKAYFEPDASVTLSGPDHRWEVALIGNDLNNEIITGNCVNAPLANGIILGGGSQWWREHLGLTRSIGLQFPARAADLAALFASAAGAGQIGRRIATEGTKGSVGTVARASCYLAAVVLT
jgi:iron complex outermembrane recepter protein